MENQRHENFFKTQGADEIAVGADAGLPLASDCELNDPRWSVISFVQTEAGGLTYEQAAAIMSELDSHDVAGLCIVTDEAAARINS